jgi:hypothetical protein
MSYERRGSVLRSGSRNIALPCRTPEKSDLLIRESQSLEDLSQIKRRSCKQERA